MELLNYKTLREAKYSGYVLQDAPVRVLQFGEGNFLRAFVDYFFDVMNEKGAFYGKVMLVQPISQGALQKLMRRRDFIPCIYAAVKMDVV